MLAENDRVLHAGVITGQRVGQELSEDRHGPDVPPADRRHLDDHAVGQLHPVVLSEYGGLRHLVVLPDPEAPLLDLSSEHPRPTPLPLYRSRYPRILYKTY